MPPQSKSGFNFPTSGAHVPEDKDQIILQTPYGRGMVIRTRKDESNIREIELTDWTATTSSGPNRPATLYSTVNYPSVKPQVDDQVLTVYGRGIVEQVGEEQVKVILSSWRLAGRSRVRCFLNPDAVKVVRKKKLYEMNVFEKVERAQEFKDEASKQFTEKDYQGALESYAKAVESVRYVQHKADSTNEVRADLLIVMVTCSNNAATCCSHLKKWDEAARFASNALTLLEAMEEKKGSKIHNILNTDGYSDKKLFGEWKAKSYLVTARAKASRHEYSEAMEAIKNGLDVVNEFKEEQVKSLQSMEREFAKLLSTCKERKKMEAEKERKRARAMFGGSTKEEDKQSTTEQTQSSSDSSKPTVKPSRPLVVDADKAIGESKSASEPGRMKKRVSFAVEEPSSTKDADEEPWYKDPEVLTGIGILSASAIASYYLLSSLLSSRK